MAESNRQSSPTKRVLLVDDDTRVLFVLAASLRRLSVPCDVISANDGHEAFRLLETSACDLLVTDIRLPGIDGITLTHLVRARSLQLPVVWVTAHGCRGLQESAARLRVFRCLEKPIEVDEFRQIVQQAMASLPFGISGDAEAPSPGPMRKMGRRR